MTHKHTIPFLASIIVLGLVAWKCPKKSNKVYHWERISGVIESDSLFTLSGYISVDTPFNHKLIEGVNFFPPVITGEIATIRYIPQDITPPPDTPILSRLAQAQKCLLFNRNISKDITVSDIEVVDTNYYNEKHQGVIRRKSKFAGLAVFGPDTSIRTLLKFDVSMSNFHVDSFYEVYIAKGAELLATRDTLGNWRIYNCEKALETLYITTMSRISKPLPVPPPDTPYRYFLRIPEIPYGTWISATDTLRILISMLGKSMSRDVSDEWQAMAARQLLRLESFLSRDSVKVNKSK